MAGTPSVCSCTRTLRESRPFTTRPWLRLGSVQSSVEPRFLARSPRVHLNSAVRLEGVSTATDITTVSELFPRESDVPAPTGCCERHRIRMFLSVIVCVVVPKVSPAVLDGPRLAHAGSFNFQLSGRVDVFEVVLSFLAWSCVFIRNRGVAWRGPLLPAR